MSARKRLPAAAGVFATVVVAVTLVAEAPAAAPAEIRELRCLSECAGYRAAAVGGRVQLLGRKLAKVSEVRFPGEAGVVAVAPARTEPRLLVAQVPDGASSGKVRVIGGDGAKVSSPQRLRVAPAAQVPDGFGLRSARARPGKAFFDQAAPIRLDYRFEASERADVRIEVVRARGTRVIRRYRRNARFPYVRQRQAWKGLEADGDVARDGRYRFRVGAVGEPTRFADSLRLHGFKFPVRGPHGYGGAGQEFGAPRNGGRVHEGHDVYAACGTRLEAARGGRVQRRAYDPALFGHYVVIDVRGSRADHVYVHLNARSPLAQGARVRTGQRVGAVGRTGNARSTPCHLHFEIWPKGFRNGSPVDPEPVLRRWDGYS